MMFQILEIKLPTLQRKYHLKTVCPWSCPIYPIGTTPVLSLRPIHGCLVICIYLSLSIALKFAASISYWKKGTCVQKLSGISKF